MSEEQKNHEEHQFTRVDGLYENWFLDYASYVILERAVPAIEDGLKPVQRRILHALKAMDDGRFHKVANVIGQTMQYHPHGDAAIGDALVNIGQKDLLFDTQGNWGDIRTGDRAAAARYIEVRLSKFALEVAFNAQTTQWQLSYDGRKKEPVTLPMKFPLLLAQGAEGIAVGLSTKILPHNFIELCEGSIEILKGNTTQLMPDFPTGGEADFSEYNSGGRGGKVKVRATIEVVDKKTLAIREIPFGTTTTSLIDSILKANDKGKLKVKRVTDNTAKNVEILIELPSGVSPDVTVGALYAFTNCENSISPNACVIVKDKPEFLTVDEILKICTKNTRNLLKRELEIRMDELEEKWHFSSLEKIFIENRIYRDIEECETWEAVIETIDVGLEPFKSQLRREVTTDDIVKLTEIKIKRISKYDSFKADEALIKLEEEMKEVAYNLKHLTKYAIKYYENLLEKYGKGKERRTQIRTFDTISAKAVAASNQKLYVNRTEGFVGTSLKKDEFVCECSDIDDIIVFRKDGNMIVSRVDDKKFVGKNILHTGIWKKGDDRTVYHMVYFDAKSKRIYAKRFSVNSITRDKEYDLTKGAEGSRVLYFSVQPNSETEVVTVYLSQNARAKKKIFPFDFGELAIKGRGAGGNILTKYAIKRIERKALGASTLGGVDLWYDPTVGRLNKQEIGQKLGNFNTGDQILVIYKDATCELTSFELTNRYQMADVLEIRKFDPEAVITLVYFDGKSKKELVKRFKVETNVLNKKYDLITDHKDSKILLLTFVKEAKIAFEYLYGKQKEVRQEELNLTEFIDVKGWRAMGNRLSQAHIKGKIQFLNPDSEQYDASEMNESEKDQDEPVKDEPKEAKDSAPSSVETKGFEVGNVVDLSADTPEKIDQKDDGVQGSLF